jgi:methylmalonyl-CoA mutase N-terminal domain/subunit
MSSSKRDWLETTYAKAVERNKEREERFETTSEIPLEPLYAPEDLNGFDAAGALGFPGEFPYTRGVQPTMYRGRLWTMRQYAGFADAEESNRRYRYLLEQGQTGLSVAFDLPTQIGYDADDPRAEGEVGKVGVSICSLEDMETLLREIPLDKVSTSMTINSTASILLALYAAVGKKQGVAGDKLNGTVQNDILKEYLARGTYRFPPEPSMRLITDMFRYCRTEVPRWNTISISGYHIREAGATAAQELGFTMANAIAYVNAALEAGMGIDEFAGQLSFFWVSDRNFFEEIAKFRAGRRLWAKLMRDRFGAKDPRSLMLRFHTQTSGAQLTAQQPLNNIIRVTLEALQAVLGGTQSLHTNSYDEALALPTEESVEIALRTQQIIGYESGAADVIDPLGGSWYIEKLTDALEEKAVAYIEKVDRMGGALVAIREGYMQREIQESSYKFQQAVEAKKATVVGVNRFARKEAPPQNLLRVDPSLREKQIARLRALRQRRDNAQVAALRQKLENAAKTKDNTIPVIQECVESYVTLGEICETLAGVFGEQKETVVF